MSDTSAPRLTGYALLHDPHANRGTAFSADARKSLGIEGLLPPTVDTLDLQIARVHTQMEALDNDLQKYLFLSDLQARNETLFYAVVMGDPATYMPLVYTPTVGEACQKYDHIFRATRGMATYVFNRGLARVPRPDDIAAHVRATAYRPHYPDAA